MNEHRQISNLVTHIENILAISRPRQRATSELFNQNAHFACLSKGKNTMLMKNNGSMHACLEGLHL